LAKNRVESLSALVVTIVAGILFLSLQLFEYIEAPFTISSSVYGSIFFLTTGFHGFHVMMGLAFIIVCTFRQLAYHFTSNHHVGFEAASWYWHFVDVV
jgi:heme/copper-type cytochrome/quinol oxidase subunit 3